MLLKFETEMVYDGIHCFINVKINDVDCRMLIDTGASSTVCGDHLSLDVFESDFGFTGFGGTGDCSFSLINISIADLHLTKYKANVINLSSINEAYSSISLKKIDGILGCDILMETSIDFNNKTIEFKNMDCEHYVYVYLNPINIGEFIYGDISFKNEPFYVGKGKGARIDYHEKYDHSMSHKTNTIKKIIRSGKQPLKIKIIEHLDEARAFAEEARLIKLIGRRDRGIGPLTNKTDGGDGVSGWIPSPSEIQRRKQASAGAKNPWFNNPTYGFKDKNHSEYSKELIRKKNKGIVITASTRIKLSETSKEAHQHRIKYCQKVSVFGVIYRSIRKASKATNICRELITDRCIRGVSGYEFLN